MRVFIINIIITERYFRFLKAFLAYGGCGLPLLFNLLFVFCMRFTKFKLRIVCHLQAFLCCGLHTPLAFLAGHNAIHLETITLYAVGKQHAITCLMR